MANQFFDPQPAEYEKSERNEGMASIVKTLNGEMIPHGMETRDTDRLKPSTSCGMTPMADLLGEEWRKFFWTRF